MSARRITENARSERSLEWDNLPVLGEQIDHAGRARALRIIAVLLVVFWAGVAFALTVIV